jgi:hypothetical protein
VEKVNINMAKLEFLTRAEQSATDSIMTTSIITDQWDLNKIWAGVFHPYSLVHHKMTDTERGQFVDAVHGEANRRDAYANYILHLIAAEEVGPYSGEHIADGVVITGPSNPAILDTRWQYSADAIRDTEYNVYRFNREHEPIEDFSETLIELDTSLAHIEAAIATAESKKIEQENVCYDERQKQLLTEIGGLLSGLVATVEAVASDPQFGFKKD